MAIKWAFNSASIMNSGWDEELALLEKYGWNAAEIWLSKMGPKLAAGATHEQLLRQLKDAGVKPIGVCAAGISPQGSKADLDAELKSLAGSLDVVATMEAGAITVISYGEVGEDLVAEYDYLVDAYRKAADLAQERGVRINLEFLGALPIVGTLGTGIELVNRVDHPAFGLLFDVSHYYVSASHIEELDLLKPGKLTMVHVNDIQRLPMEKVKNDQRTFPGEGRVDVPRMLNTINSVTHYDGYYCVELFGEDMWAIPADEVMQRLDKSLKEVESKIDFA